MSNEVDAFLEHHGVKGQHWGIRNQERDIRKLNKQNQKYIDKHITNKTGVGTGSPLRSLRRAQVGPSGEKLSRKDRKWQANIYSTNAWIHLHNKVADVMNNGEIEKFNNRPHFKNHQGGFINPDGSPKEDAMSKRYFKEYGELFASHVDKIVKSDPTAISPSGKYKATVRTIKDPDGFLNFHLDVFPTGVRHANDSPPEFHFELNLDDTGRVISVRKIKTEMAQSYISNGFDFLEHHGVKGMTWKSKAPEKLTRVARVASGTEFKNKNFQSVIKAKLKAISDAIKEQEKKKKEYENDLKELDNTEDKSSEDKSSDDEFSNFLKKHGDSSVKEFVSTENEASATSNE